MARFGTVLTAMVTPFSADGGLDLDGAAGLARWLVDNGSEGLVVAATTGEGPVLDDNEKLDLWSTVAEAVTVPVIAGTGSNDTAHSVELTRRAGACGAAGVMVVTPYYNRPSQAGIAGHFRAVAAATDLPVLAYDIPVRTGRKIGNDTLLGVARDTPNLLGVKDAALDVAGSARLAAAAPPGFEIYSGNDDQTLALLAVGAVGVIGVATHWAADRFGEMISSFCSGDLEGARRANAGLFESYDFQTSDAAPNPVPAKAMMRVLGHKVGHCRPPHDAGPDDLEQRAQAVLRGLGHTG